MTQFADVKVSLDAQTAVDRLLTIALNHDNGGASRVAAFLLAWWNGQDLGHFPVIDIANVDPEIGKDMLSILAFLNRFGVHYADAFGRRAEMERLIDIWRPLAT